MRRGQVLFSRSTYLVEVIDGESAWVFVQLDDSGLTQDAFCSCPTPCEHLLFAIKLLERPEPLHVLFERSFFKKIFFEAAVKSEFSDSFTPESAVRFSSSSCTIETEDPLLQSLLSNPPKEIENNSLKFSQRTTDEINQWKEGRPDPEFAFELSIFSDLAKHYFIGEVLDKVPLIIGKNSFQMGRDTVYLAIEYAPDALATIEKKKLSWSFDPKKNELIIDDEIQADVISVLKTKGSELRQRGFPLFPVEAPLKLQLHFDGEVRASISKHNPSHAFLGPYVWIEKKGFFMRPFWLEGALSIKENQELLNQHPGFHVYHHPPKLTINFSIEEKGIHFSAEKGLVLKDWIYLPEDGFYPRIANGKTCLAGTFVPYSQLPEFIQSNEEALEEVPGFFIEKPFDSLGVSIQDLQGQIVISLDIGDAKLIDRFLVVKDKGVYPLKLEEMPPDILKEPLVISEKEAPLFIASELSSFYPLATHVDPSLRPLEDIKLVTEGGDILYETPFGFLKPFVLAAALRSGIYRTEKGYIDLRKPRFEWLEKLEGPRLTPLDRMRLSAFDEGPKNLWPEEKELPSIPEFKATLRSYQKRGVEWLWTLYQKGLSGLLADDMGLGKTYQAIAFMAAVFEASPNSKILVLTPTSVLYHWRDKIQSCLPHKKINFFYGPDRVLDKEADIIITSYGMARSESEKLKKLELEALVFDEIQVAKNRLSQTWSLLSALKGRFRLGLTGTPIENNLKELKSLFDLIVPGFLGSAHRFREQFINPIEHQGSQERRVLLRKLTSPFLLRRTKEECLPELPPKVEDVLWCELSEEQKELYQGVLYQNQKLIEQLKEEEGPLPYMTLLALLIQLKKICNHPALFLNDCKNWQNHDSGKWQVFVDLLEQTKGQKVVVFSHYLGMLDIIEDYLRQQKIGFAALRGSTKDRSVQVNRFQTDPECRVFVASLQAAGLGIDLTAANVVIHYDRWWNAARENQATDRVHRFGQKFPVQVFKLANMASVEENIDRLITKKARLFTDIITTDGSTNFKTFTDKEWLEILSFVTAG